MLWAILIFGICSLLFARVGSDNKQSKQYLSALRKKEEQERQAEQIARLRSMQDDLDRDEEENDIKVTKL